MHFRTKSSQPVLPAALRELVSMEMILPKGGREKRDVTRAQQGCRTHPSAPEKKGSADGCLHTSSNVKEGGESC